MKYWEKLENKNGKKEIRKKLNGYSLASVYGIYICLHELLNCDTYMV